MDHVHHCYVSILFVLVTAAHVHLLSVYIPADMTYAKAYAPSAFQDDHHALFLDHV
jgi:hypothetical protein